MKLNKQEMTRGTQLTLIISGAALALGLVILVLFSAQVIALTENAKMAAALIITAAMIVFAYTICKHLGVLKNQKR